MQILKNMLKVLPAALLLASCNNVDFKKTKSGIPYKVIGSGKGDLIKPNDIIKFHVIQKKNDSVLFSTYGVGEPQYAQVTAPPAVASYGDIGTNVMEIFSKARKGDSIYIYQIGDSLLAKTPPLAQQINLKKGDKMITTVRVLEVYKTQEEANAAYTADKVKNADKTDQQTLARFTSDSMVQRQMRIDNQIIEAYLASKNIQTQKTPWGAYVQIIDPGTGPKPAAGQYANVKYRGTDLKGTEFDSGVYPLQIGMSQSIKGFEEGIKQLGKGGKAKVFIPSMLGYGPRGSAQKIKPNENLIFDIELLDITDKQPAQPAVPVDTTGGQGGR
jgi:FKBP-type peptidyl-prolyl cis-trans isomerase FkpA